MKTQTSQPEPSENDAIGYALIRATSTATHWAIVRITKRGKRFTEVETLHEDPAERKHWRETTRGLWDFTTLEAAQAERAMLDQIYRDHKPHPFQDPVDE